MLFLPLINFLNFPYYIIFIVCVNVQRGMVGTEDPLAGAGSPFHHAGPGN